MGGAEWIDRMLADWQSQVLGGFLGAEASPRVLLIAGAWPLARGGVGYALMYIPYEAKGAGRLGCCPAGVCPATGLQDLSLIV